MSPATTRRLGKYLEDEAAKAGKIAAIPGFGKKTEENILRGIGFAETSGQLLYEWQHLKTKLSVRSTSVLSQAAKVKEPRPHPLFRIIPGQVRNWERRKAEPESAAYGAKLRHR